MWSISAACKTALLGDHTRTVVAEIYNAFGSMLAATYTNPGFQLGVDGQIQVQRRATHARMLTATVIDVDGSLAPSLLTPTVDPLRLPQMQVYFDIGWVDDATGSNMTERIPAGRFTIARSTGKELGSGETIAIFGTSRSSFSITRNKWADAPYNVVANVTYDVAIKQALADRTQPGWLQEFRFETSQFITAYGIIFGGDGRSDPWTDLQNLATADGKDLTDDQVGAFVLRKPPDPLGVNPVWAYNEAQNTGKISNTMSRDIDLANAYNGVILRSSAPWLTVPVLSTVWDLDPSSPTFKDGPFGRNPFPYDDAMVSTQEQGDAAAAAKFTDVLGVMEQIDFQGLVNPAHDPGDVVAIASAATGVSDNALLESFTLPFDVTKSTTATVKRRRRR